tara:strand:+ start:663 stop:923 length:261 start_codon:yes stop_codon:yes gene_type:complete
MQVQNVFLAELHRKENSIGEVQITAVNLYHEAREELIRRGIEPDTVLGDDGEVDPYDVDEDDDEDDYPEPHVPDAATQTGMYDRDF